MPRHLLSLLLLTVLSLGLFAGPHPCKKPDPARKSPHSCHEAAQGQQQDDKEDCSDSSCQHACHMNAIADVVRIVFTVTPVSQAIVEPSDPDFLLFAQPIDHIPLA